MFICPNKSEKAWKELVAAAGELAAYQLWIDNDYKTPSLKDVILPNKEVLSKRPHPVTTIISGGETGVEQAALRAAKKQGLVTQGTAPSGFATDAGPNVALQEKFGLTPAATTNRVEKNKANVNAAEATAVFGDENSISNAKVIEYANSVGKPVIINPSSTELQDFLNDKNISTLNITGDKSSKMSTQAEFDLTNALDNALFLPKAAAKLNASTGVDDQTMSQKEVVDKVVEEHNKLIGPDYAAGEDRYKRKVDGIIQEIKSRVTDRQTILFEKKVGKERAKEINERPENIIKRENGIKLHATAEVILNSLLNGTKPTNPGYYSDQYFQVLYNGIKPIAEQIKATQKSIDPSGALKFLSEHTLYDQITDTAGSVDAMVVYSDGSVAIFDWKFINFKTDKKGKIIEGVKDSKIESYDMQISEYKRILAERYGVTKFRESRIIPVNVQYQSKTVNGKFQMLDKIKSIQIGSNMAEELAQIPVAQELTNNEQLDEMLLTLSGLAEREANTMKGATNKEAKKARIYRLKEAIKKLQIDRDIKGVLYEIYNYSKDTDAAIGIDDVNDPLYIEDLSIVSNTIKQYENIIDNVYVHLKSLPEAEATEAQEALNKATAMLKLLEHTNKSKSKDRVIVDAQKKGIANILETQPESSFLGGLYTYLSRSNHPMFKLLNEYVRKINDGTRLKYNALEEKLNKKKESLEAWGKANGRSGLDIYKEIVDLESGQVTSEFSKDFYKKRKEAIDSKDVKTLKSLYAQTAENKKEFEKAKKQKFKEFDLYYNKSEDRYKREGMKKKWLSENDLSLDSAWLYTEALYKFAEIQNKDDHRSDKYKFIMKNKPLMDFYTFYTETMSDLLKTLPYEKRKNKFGTFIAEIQEDMIDTVAKSGISSIKDIGKSFINSLEIREDDADYGMIDPLTGDLTKQVPILFMSPITNKKGDVDPSQKSIDLAKSLSLFGGMVYNYQHTTELEGNIHTLREVLANQSQIVTDKTGNPIQTLTGKMKEAIGSGDTLKQFDKFINYYVYGEKIQNKDVKVKFGEKELSGNKALLKTMSWFSTKNLAVNLFSAGANYVGATSNAWITGKKGKFYDSKQFRQSITEISKMDKKAGAFAGFFEVSQEDLTYRKANNLSLSKLSKWLTVDNMMILQRKGDDFVDASVTNAMGKNYGINPETGKVEKLNRLPEGTKSIYELATVTEKGLKIDGLSETEFNRFRHMVRAVTGSIKGTTTDEDINLIQTYTLGKMVMQFRNWLPRMAEERFQKTRYDYTTNEIEIGRFRAGFGELALKGLVPTITKFTADLAFGWTGIYKYTPNDVRTQKFFNEFIAANPTFVNNYGGDLEAARKAYAEERAGQLRALAVEIRMYLTVLAAITAMGMDWDDDDVPLYKEFAFTRTLHQLANRSALELGFFLSPSEATAVLKQPVAIIGLLTDIQKLVTNTADETRDFVFGEDSFGQKPYQDRSGKFNYTLKQIPLIKPLTQFLEILWDDELNF